MGSDAYDSSVSDSMVEWGEKQGLFLRCLPSKKSWVTQETLREIEKLSKNGEIICALCNNTYTNNYRLICHLRSHFIRQICPCNRINFSNDSHSRHQRKTTDDIAPLCKLRMTYNVDRESFDSFCTAMKLAIPGRFDDVFFPTFYPAPVKEKAPDSNQSSSSSSDFNRQLRVCLRDAIRSVHVPAASATSNNPSNNHPPSVKAKKFKSKKNKRTYPYPPAASATSSVPSTSVPQLRSLTPSDRRQHEALSDLSVRMHSISTWVREQPRTGEEVSDQLNYLRSLIEQQISNLYDPK